MRYAVYYAPAPESRLHQLGTQWLQQDGMEVPRRYGFHATLKAPFRLAPGRTEADLVRALQSLAHDFECTQIGELVLSVQDGFLALRPKAWCQEAQELANACVIALDYLRAPLTPEELTHRRAESLGPDEMRNLARYGYPHVLRQFAFHLTLSNRRGAGELEALRKQAAPFFAPVMNIAYPLDRLSLFVERQPGAQFEMIRQFELRSSPGMWPELWKWGAA